MTPYQTTEDLLIIEEEYVRASMGKRLANHLIDLTAFYMLLIILMIFFIMIAPTSYLKLLGEESQNDIEVTILSLILYALYMGAVEALFKGKSLGKLITKCRAVNEDGSYIKPAKAFARGFSRAVPFCAFSALGNPSNPWQDRWTNTMVVNDQKK